MTGLTKNEFKSSTINGVLNVVDYMGITGTFKCDIIQPQTTSLTINGPVYIPYSVWTTLTNNYYNQFATGYDEYLNQFS